MCVSGWHCEGVFWSLEWKYSSKEDNRWVKGNDSALSFTYSPSSSHSVLAMSCSLQLSTFSTSLLGTHVSGHVTSLTASPIVLHSAGSVFGYEIGLWHVVAVVTFPVSFLKQVVSLVQLVVASQNIGVLDSSRREKNRKQ